MSERTPGRPAPVGGLSVLIRDPAAVPSAGLLLAGSLVAGGVALGRTKTREVSETSRV